METPTLARRLRGLPLATVCGRRVRVAVGLRARLLGLALLKPGRAGAGLLVPRCASVHTFGMRFPLDLVFLDAEGRELSRRHRIGPYRIASDRRAAAVLELPSGTEREPAARREAAGARNMTAREVQVRPLSLERLLGLIGPEARRRFEVGLARAQGLTEGRRIWNVNSTAAGGGVAELLWSWVGLAQGVGVDMRWLTIDGDGDFFVLTKRLHNYLHGELGDGGELGEAERAVYEEVCRANAADVLGVLGPNDVVLLHDPQTAGLIPHLAGTGRTVIWRCHVGADESNDLTAAAWDFLGPYVTDADAVVFSRRSFVPACCQEMVTAIIPPSIDPFSPKNQDMAPEQVRAILRQAGLLAPDAADGADPVFVGSDGARARVERSCETIAEGGLPSAEAPLVVQVSRWDRLKDPVGVMRGFAETVSDRRDVRLILAGPSLGSVTDDPDGAAVLAEVEADWGRLPAEVRARVLLACLPMEDLDENAAIVNALQRQATVVVQKSIKEGFGLTVTEAMWKARPLVASATGGIEDQIEDGVTGMLLENPLDLRAFALLLGGLLDAPERARETGRAARESVRRHFLEDRHTLQYVELLERLLG
jgi:trehalose synthase